jgi:hypothetical protein
MTARAETKIEGGGAALAAVSALRTVPPRWREKFMRAVGDQLALVQSPTNKAVLEVCAAARRAITVGIPYRMM